VGTPKEIEGVVRGVPCSVVSICVLCIGRSEMFVFVASICSAGSCWAVYHWLWSVIGMLVLM